MGLLRRMVCQVCRNGVMEARLLRERPLRPRQPEIIPVRGRAVRLREAPYAAISVPAFVREAERLVMPLCPPGAGDTQAHGRGVDAQLRVPWQRWPWRG